MFGRRENWEDWQRPSDWSKGRRKKPRPPPNLELLEKQLEKALSDRERGVGKRHKAWENIQNRRIEMLQSKIHSHPDYIRKKIGEQRRIIDIKKKMEIIKPPPKDEPRAITLRIGEYDDRLPPPRKGESSGLPREPRAITMKIGEYDDRLPDRNVTTLALGEEDGMVGKPIRPPKAPRNVTTLALGEEDGIGRRPPKDTPIVYGPPGGHSGHEDKYTWIRRPGAAPFPPGKEKQIKEAIKVMSMTGPGPRPTLFIPKWIHEYIHINYMHPGGNPEIPEYWPGDGGRHPVPVWVTPIIEPLPGEPKPESITQKKLTGSKPKTDLERLHALNLAVSKKGGARVSKLMQERDVLAEKLHRPGVHNITAMSRDRISELKDQIHIARQTRPQPEQSRGKRKRS